MADPAAVVPPTHAAARRLLRKLEDERMRAKDRAREILLGREDTRSLALSTIAAAGVRPRLRSKGTECLAAPSPACLFAEAASRAAAISGAARRDWALNDVAAAQIRAGLVEDARATLHTMTDPRLIVDRIREMAAPVGAKVVFPTPQGNGTHTPPPHFPDALRAAEAVGSPPARDRAMARVALLAFAHPPEEDPGSSFSGEGIAARIGDAQLRAGVLWAAAAAQARKGAVAGANAIASAAEAATRSVPSGLGRVTVYAEAAEQWSAAGAPEYARALWQQGLDLARGFTSAWGAARAFTRLASALIVVDGDPLPLAGDGHAASP